MSAHTLEYSGLHSCNTLGSGIEMVEHGEHCEPPSDVDAMIKASQERLAAAQHRLAILQKDQPMKIPEDHPAGAPYIARQEGEFAAGTAACDLKSHPAPTVIIESPLTVVTTSSDMAEHPDNQLGLESQGQDLFGAGTPVPSPEAPPPLPPPDEITPPPPPAPAMDSRELESNKPSPEPIKPAPTVLQPWNAKHPHYWKMYRYFQQTKHDGSLKCTKEALEMYQSKGGCEKLAELLNRHGNFAKVEVALKKWHERKDPDGALLDGDFVPSMSASSSDLVNLAVSRSDGGQTDVKNDSVRADGSSFKLCYPSLKQNTSHAELLGGFVDVCSRKIDNTQKVIDTLHAVNTARATELVSQIETVIEQKKKTNKRMMEIQGELLVDVSRNFESELQNLFASCTKLDVTLNNFVTRSKQIKKPKGSLGGASSKAASKKRPKAKAKTKAKGKKQPSEKDT